MVRHTLVYPRRKNGLLFHMLLLRIRNDDACLSQEFIQTTANLGLSSVIWNDEPEGSSLHWSLLGSGLAACRCSDRCQEAAHNDATWLAECVTHKHVITNTAAVTVHLCHAGHGNSHS